MQYKNGKALALATAIVLAFGSTAASAGYKLATSNLTTPIAGGSVTVTVLYDSDGATTATQSDIIINTAQVSFVSATSNTASSLCSLIGGNRLRSQENLPTNGVIPNSTLCTYVLTANAGPAGQVMPLAFSDFLFIDIGGADTSANHTNTNGSLTWLAGPPPDVVVTFNPASASTIAFGGGAPGANVTQSIALGNTGTIGSGTVSGCVLSGPDAASFSITSGNPSTVPPATSIGLQATLGAAALSATLTCNVADASATTSVTWPLTAPAGTVLQAPTLASNPASGASITLPNSYGTPVTSPISITPTGGDAGGPNASVTCSTASAGFTVTPAGALTFTPPGGAAQNAVVGCTPGASPVGGVVTCTGTHQGGAINWSYDVTCPAAQTAPPPPTFVPATSLWSKLALFGVFAALGMLVLGLRRNH